MLVAALGLAACGADESGDDRVIVKDDRLGLSGESVGELRPRRLEQFAAVDLPASARIVRSYASAGMDSMVEVTIEMEAEDVDRFARQSELPTLRRGPPPFDPGSGKRIGWDVASMSDVQVAEDRALDVHRRVAVTRDGTVYLQAFQT